MANQTISYFQANNRHPHHNANQAQLLEQLAESAVIKNDYNRETLSGAKSLSEGDARVQSLDPDGAGRTVTLPPEAEGLTFVIANRAGAANAITLNDDSGSTLVTVSQNNVAECVSDGTGWVVQMAAGAVT